MCLLVLVREYISRPIVYQYLCERRDIYTRNQTEDKSTTYWGQRFLDIGPWYTVSHYIVTLIRTVRHTGEALKSTSVIVTINTVRFGKITQHIPATICLRLSS